MENKSELVTNSSQIGSLKSTIDNAENPSILCTNIKSDNPHFLGIVHANDHFCQTFKIDPNEILGKSYDFLFENQETDYSSEDQIEIIKLINAIKNNQSCKVTQVIKNFSNYDFAKYNITLVPVLEEEKKRYFIINFEQCVEDIEENEKIKTRQEDIGSKNQELVKSLERALNNEKILREISYQIISDKPVKDIAKNICESICNILKVDRCIIYDLKQDEIGSVVEYNNSSNKNLDISHQDAHHYILSQNEFYRKIKKDMEKTSIFVTDDVAKKPNAEEYAEFYEKYNISSQICAVSIFNGKSNGGIYIFSSTVRNPTIDEVEMIEIITDQLSIAIERSNSIEKIVSANNELLKKTEELKKSVQKEKEMREMQSKFISLVSHEFKTPLQIIDSSRELISRKIKTLGLHDEVFEKYTARVKNAIKRMTDLINSTLNLAKVEENESGQMNINKEELRLHDLLNDVISKISDLLIKRNVSIKKIFNATDDLISADPGLLGHCFSNIVSNAIKYSKKDTQVKIATRSNEKAIQITILDQGIGIPTQDLEKIGQKFFRSSNTLSESGSGIGLYLTKYFIELHNGHVTIESKENIGTKVTITLPKK